MNREGLFQKFKKRDIFIAICTIVLSVCLGLSDNFTIMLDPFLGFKDSTVVVPGWHTSINPIKFPLEQFLLVLLLLQFLLILTFFLFKNRGIISLQIIELVNVGLLIIGLILLANFLFELFVSFYTGYIYEQFNFYSHVFGSYWWTYFFSILIKLILPQLFWFKSIRKSTLITLVICIAYLSVGFVVRIIL
ncbi:MAG: hypothetical protein JNL70_06915 [Saprospiraceae bacterium]|nr:hypothetical protein [Saprospiraceae bacterium]